MMLSVLSIGFRAWGQYMGQCTANILGLWCMPCTCSLEAGWIVYKQDCLDCLEAGWTRVQMQVQGHHTGFCKVNYELLTWVEHRVVRNPDLAFKKTPFFQSHSVIPDDTLMDGRNPDRHNMHAECSSSTTAKTQARVCSGRGIWQGLTLPMDSHMAAWSASALACRACFSSSVIAASSCCRSYS